MHWLRSAASFTALLAATTLAFGGCNQCGSSGQSGGGQHLVFTGPAAGTLTDATAQCRVFTSQKQLNYLFTGSLGGQDLTFNVQVNAYTGPGTYQVGSLLDGSANLRLQIGSYVGSSATGAGTVIIESNGKSGVVDANVGGGEHVTGAFRCDEVITA
jgi:hypothetical protein